MENGAHARVIYMDDEIIIKRRDIVLNDNDIAVATSLSLVRAAAGRRATEQGACIKSKCFAIRATMHFISNVHASDIEQMMNERHNAMHTILFIIHGISALMHANDIIPILKPKSTGRTSQLSGREKCAFVPLRKLHT